VNPVMAPLLEGTGQAFAFVKFGLTAVGIIMLTILARLRVFGRSVGYILYMVLAGYVVLVSYELFLLRNIPLD
jgi:hypothetical protein